MEAAVTLTHAGFGNAHTALDYALAGKAYVTLVSAKTGVRFTYKIERDEDEHAQRWYVAALTGSDNARDYTYLGTLFSDGQYRHGKKSRLDPKTPCARAFDWAWQQLSSGRLPETLTVLHEGRCGRCGRMLTTPDSIAAGLGPDCRAK